nr:hypothetical protein [Tanacetum cinerariifolium]
MMRLELGVEAVVKKDMKYEIKRLLQRLIFLQASLQLVLGLACVCEDESSQVIIHLQDESIQVIILEPWFRGCRWCGLEGVLGLSNISYSEYVIILV